jgi:exosortase
MEIAGITNKRNIIFISFSIISLIIFYVPLKELLRHSYHEELYSHIILVPFISGYFIFLKRKQIRLVMGYSFKIGIIPLITGTLIYFIGKQEGGLNSNDHLSLMIFSALVFWIGGFILFYGLKSFKIASFALLFLFFMIPIPSKVVEAIISILQIGSAEAAYGFFKLTGVPILREGFTFHLPGMSIEVAKQCSGIRSSIALFITSIIAGQFFLRAKWKKLVLVLCIFPITVLKNGLRIVTLSLLGAYVDPRILGSQLHKSGGIPFFFIALMLLAPILLVLKKSEEKEQGSRLKDKG